MLKPLIKGFLRIGLKPIFGTGFGIALQRRWLTIVTSTMPAPRGVLHQQVDMGGVAAERSATAGHTGGTILYLHGGGYCIGTARGVRVITGHLCKAAGADVYAPEYRLAPEHPHPAALEDALKCYRWLLAQGIAPRSIAIAGDSAGAGLALATAIALRESGLPAPAALGLISPWIDLGCGGDTHATVGARDPLLTTAGLKRWAAAYLGPLPADHPGCSPLFASLRRLPPMLIQVGSEEVLLADSTRLYQRAVAAGTAAELREFPGLWHYFQFHAGMLRESNAALAEIADFLKWHWQDENAKK